ncbi:MAG: efflux RND transporter permease subunit, partial [Verrucomicrobiota bacterium]
TVGAGWAFQFVPNIFFPPNERGQFIINLELPLGTDITETERRVTEFEEWLLSEHEEEIRSVSAWIGNSGPRWYLSLSSEDANPNYSFMTVLTHTSDPNEVKELTEKVNNQALAMFPSARLTAQVLESGPPVGDPIQIRLYGRDLSTLYELRDEIVEEVKTVNGLFDVRDDWGAWVKQIYIDPNPVRVARLGLTTQDIATSLNLQFSGTTVTSYREDEKSIPVVVRSRTDVRDQPERLPDVPIFTTQGVVPLGQVAETGVELLPGSILRENSVRVMTIKAKVRGRFASEALAEIQPKIAELTSSEDWPNGYRVEYGGESEESAESQESIGAVMPISLAMLSLILVMQFNSLRRFVIIMLTVPPMLIGVVPGLLITGSSFGFMTLLGLIALLGIIVNNAILLIDETNQQLTTYGLTDAVVEAAKSRLRPILMTAITSIIGLAPLAFGGGGMWSSMAFAMMFGLGFATLLTLLLCPVLFFLFFRRTFTEEAPVPASGPSLTEADPIPDSPESKSTVETIPDSKSESEDSLASDEEADDESPEEEPKEDETKREDSGSTDSKD